MKKGFFFIFLSILLFSCSKPRSGSERDRIPLLEVEGKFLYKDEIDKIIPPNSTVIDSADIADRYIKKWVTDVLIYENAQRNADSTEAIDKLVESYRKSLIIHQYEQALVGERLSDKIPESELQEFYKNYSSQLILQENLIQGILLVVPLNAPQINQMREWVRSANTSSLENIEKYMLKNAISYDYFMDKWIPFSEILKKVPFKIQDTGAFITGSKFAEVADSTKYYFLHISKALPIGQVEPYERAKDRIASILLNQKKSDFIIQFENEIYNDAVKEGSINYFTKK